MRITIELGESDIKVALEDYARWKLSSSGLTVASDATMDAAIHHDLADRPGESDHFRATVTIEVKP